MKPREYMANLKNATDARTHIEAMMETDGWKLVEQLLAEYRSRRYDEWKRGELGNEQWRSDCIVLDWLLEGLNEICEVGQRAGVELQNRTRDKSDRPPKQPVG